MAGIVGAVATVTSCDTAVVTDVLALRVSTMFEVVCVTGENVIIGGVSVVRRAVGVGMGKDSMDKR